MYTKRDFVTAAFEEIGYATYVFDLQPEQLQSALSRLDRLMAKWNAVGIRVGYPLPSGPAGSDLDEVANVPDSAFEAIVSNLALRIAPTVGKSVSPETKQTAAMAYQTLLSRAAMPMEMQLPDTMPVGQGNKPWRYDQPYFQRAVEPLLAGQDAPIEFD